VLVCEGRHGHLSIEYRGHTLSWREISAPSKPYVSEVHRGVRRTIELPALRTQAKWRPPADHPWRQAIRKAVQKRASKLTARDAAIRKGSSLSGCALTSPGDKKGRW
jgi:hypothetical protein